MGRITLPLKEELFHEAVQNRWRGVFRRVFLQFLAVQARAQPDKKVAMDADLTLVEGNNEFAFDLYTHLAKEKGNKFFSPYSISTALGITYTGARGNTAKEIAKTLHFTLDKDRLHPAFGELIRKVNGPDKKRGYELAVANSLWGNKSDLSLHPKFLRTTLTDYQGSFQFVDFSGNPTVRAGGSTAGSRARPTTRSWT